MWKTGVAITLSLIVSRIFNVPEPVFTAIVAIIGVQPTVVQTFKYGYEQVLAVVVGAAVALGVLAILAYVPSPIVRAFAAGAAAILAMWLCLVLRWFDAVILAACTVVVVLIVAETGDNYLGYSFDRLIATVVGTVVATLVNIFMIWPLPEDQFPRRLPTIASQAFNEFEDAVRLFYRRDAEGSREALAAWNRDKRIFDLAAAELIWFQESRFVKQLVPYRRRELAPVFSEIYSIIDSIHQAAKRLLVDTIRAVEDNPDRFLDSARVADAIENVLRIPSELKAALSHFLNTGDIDRLRDLEFDWRLDLHQRLMVALRTAYKSSRDIFPLFELAMLGVELRNYTRYLAQLRRLIISNERLLAKLRPTS